MNIKLPKLQRQRGRFQGYHYGTALYGAPFYPVKDVELFIERAKALRKSHRQLEAKLAEKDALLQGCIAVPKVELEKLEEARVALYTFLEGKLNERQLLELPNITGQIWRVANRKTWEELK